MWPQPPFLSSHSRGSRSSEETREWVRVCVSVFWGSRCGEWSGCVCEEGRQGWGRQRTNTTRVLLPLLHNNNNRRRDVFCGLEEVRDGRFKREEEGKEKKWKTEMKECKGERISKQWEEENEDEERGKLIIEKTTGNRMKREEVNLEEGKGGKREKLSTQAIWVNSLASTTGNPVGCPTDQLPVCVCVCVVEV